MSTNQKLQAKKAPSPAGKPAPASSVSYRRTNSSSIVESHIGYGAPHKQDSSAAHGDPLGEEEVRLAERSYDWPEDARFLVPDGVREHFRDGVGRRGRHLHEAWVRLSESYRSRYSDLAGRLQRMQTQALPDGWDAELPGFAADAKGLASRDSSAKVLNAIASHYLWLVTSGGAARKRISRC